MKKVAIMQPYFMPYIGYFQLIHAANTFVVLDDVNYINKGWINRNNILMNGKPHLITLPLKEASQNKKINEIALSDDPKWREKLLTMISHAYKKAVYFEPVYTMLSDLLAQEYTSIAALNVAALKWTCTYLEMATKLVESSSIYGNNELKGQERIRDICLKEEAGMYINPIGGTELYTDEFFTEKGISLRFIKSEKISYQQMKNEFVPWLSMLDVLMFNDAASIRMLMNTYRLIGRDEAGNE